MSQNGPSNKDDFLAQLAQKPAKIFDIKYCIHEIEVIKKELTANQFLDIPSHIQSGYKKKKKLCCPDGRHIDLTKLSHVIFFAQGANDECTIPKEYMDELLVPYHRYKIQFAAIPLMIRDLESIQTLLPEVRSQKITLLQDAFVRLQRNRGMLCHFLNLSAIKRKNYGRKAAEPSGDGDYFLNQDELIQDFIEHSKFNIIDFNKDLRQPFVQFFQYLLLASQGKVDTGMEALDKRRVARARIFIDDCGGPESLKAMIKAGSPKAHYGPLSSRTLKWAIKSAIEEIEEFKLSEKLKLSEEYRLMQLEFNKLKAQFDEFPDSDSEPVSELVMEFSMESNHEPADESEVLNFRGKRRADLEHKKEFQLLESRSKKIKIKS